MRRGNDDVRLQPGRLGGKAETLDGVNQELVRVLEAKESRRRELARLPWPEKVALVVRLQKMAEPVLKNRNKRARIWTI